MRRFLLVLGLAAFGVAAACADDGDDPGVLPDPTPIEEAGTSVDAPLVGLDAPVGDQDADVQPGDTCGDRAGLQSNASWPVAGGCPTRSGVTALTGPRTANARLNFAYAGGESSPVVGSDGYLWFGSKDGIVYAIPPNGGPRVRRIGGEITSTGAIAANGTFVIGGPDGTLYGLTLGAPPDPADGGDAGGGVDGGTLLPIAFSVSLGAPIKSSPVIGADSTIYVGTTDGKLVAVKPPSAIQWRADTGDTFGSSPALARDGTVYVGSIDHKLHAIGSDGQVKWATDLGAEIKTSPAIGGDGTIYIGTTAGKLHAVTQEGAIKWTYEAGAALVGTPAVYAGGVYTACEDKRVHAANVIDGTPRWAFLTQGTPRTPLVTEGGYVYFGSTDGRVYVTTPKGGLFFADIAKGLVTSGPGISRDGVIYWATDQGLSALGP